jgi:peptidoglycan hydrolase-like protein with peptidoglycan-binding domain
VDGVYGSRTRAAVRSFQSDHGNGLEPDGIYGPNTRDAFDQELNGGAEDDE